MAHFEAVIPRLLGNPLLESNRAYVEEQFPNLGILSHNAVYACAFTEGSVENGIPLISDKWYLDKGCTDEQVCMLALLTGVTINKFE